MPLQDTLSVRSDGYVVNRAQTPCPNHFFHSEGAVGKALTAVLLAAALAQSVACSPKGGQGAPPTTSAVQESNPPGAEFVRRKLSIETLDRMLGDGDSGQAMESTGNGSKESLVESGAVFISDGTYVAETNISERGTSEQPVEDTRMDAVEAGLSEILRVNDVAWCGMQSLSGADFMQQYMERHGDFYEPHEDYAESIDDYAACGSRGV
jgi:hypothetical protein